MALSKDALGSGQWKTMRLRVLARDGWVCTYCNKHLEGADATVDHITSRKQGGSVFDMDNLTSACKSCNSSKGTGFFRRGSTPPVFPDSSHPETVRIVPNSPFMNPEGIQVNAD